MQASQPEFIPGNLSICETISARSGGSAGADWLRETILGEQQPYFVASRQKVAQAWSGMHGGNLMERLDRNTKVRLFITPTGVLGYYNENLVQVFTRDGKPWGRVMQSDILPQGEIELPHVQLGGVLVLSGYTAFLLLKGVDNFVFNPNERVYVRTVDNILPQVTSFMPPEIPVDDGTCAHVSLYVSQAGTVTNLHWDAYSGVIHQLKGRKRVIFFPPDQTSAFDMYPNRHIFARRSQLCGKLNEEALRAHPELAGVRGYECVVGPDEWLYIPANWLHYVETLDDDTISLITRFTR